MAYLGAYEQEESKDGAPPHPEGRGFHPGDSMNKNAIIGIFVGAATVVIVDAVYRNLNVTDDSTTSVDTPSSEFSLVTALPDSSVTIAHGLPPPSPPPCIHENCFDRLHGMQCTIERYGQHQEPPTCTRYEFAYEHHCDCDKWGNP
jgi:hypothetical protein